MVVHVAVSLDGAVGGFDIDVGTYYQLTATWSEDDTLVEGAERVDLASALRRLRASIAPAG